MPKIVIIIVCSSILGALVVIAASQLLWLKFSGSPVPRPVIDRGPQTIGSGPARTYAVLGDSTSISQGSAYADGYATHSASFLAKTYTVTWVNEGVSGARAADVLTVQLPKVLPRKPDIVLIGVGANDVTHGTAPTEVAKSIRKTVTLLRQANPNVQIVITGSPDMGSVPRIPQPLRWLAGKRTVELNKALVSTADQLDITFAPIAAKTGPIFRKHPELFAADNFHPNMAGYKLWTPVITNALNQHK